MIFISILAVIVLLGVLIFAHELGHFLAAKFIGVGVLKFSLGFGPKLIGKKFGETEYLICAIPLGGYVRLLGESEEDTLSEVNDKGSFLRQPVLNRISIVMAGPIFNFLLAIVIFTVIYMWGVPILTTQIGGIQENSAAFESGVRVNDIIVAIDGRKVSKWTEMADIVSKSRGKELRITIERNHQLQDIVLVPKLLKTKNIFGEDIDSYKIGVSPSSKTYIERLNPIKAFWYSLQQTWLISKLTVLSIVKIFEGAISPKTLGGPILIAQIAGAQVKEGFIPFLLFMALLSINLAVLNLLPIPVLDGGHLLFYFIEIASGREVNIKWRERAQQIGFVVLIMLMIFVFIMDIDRLSGNKTFDDVIKIFQK